MKKAFTMVEIIFVIVILAILSSIAIPKLSATRDDAIIAKEIANFKTCKKDIQNSYTATGYDGITRDTMGIMTSGPSSCMELKCITVDGYGTAINKTIFKASLFSTTSSGNYCKAFFDTVFPKYKNMRSIPPIIYQYDLPKAIY